MFEYGPSNVRYFILIMHNKWFLAESIKQRKNITYIFLAKNIKKYTRYSEFQNTQEKLSIHTRKQYNTNNLFQMNYKRNDWTCES